MERMAKDERFAHVINDARFKPVPSKGRKVKIDKRFQSMFKDSNFKVKYSMDSKGRPVKHTSTEELRKFYDLSSTSESEEDDETVKSKGDDIAGKKEDQSSRKDAEVKESDCTGKDLNSQKRKAAKENYDSDDSNSSPKPENDMVHVGTESGSTTSEESDLENLDDEFDHHWGELHADAPEIDHATNRFAICHMDWDRIKAEDLFVLLSSFKPPDKVIHSVKIYPSEYGMQRMKEEEVRGPKELVDESLHCDNEEDEERSEYHREKLRKYQINRLKYYFAIVECDSPETASMLYNELDGMEYESSASCLDLRFVPEDMIFEQEPSSVATSMPNMSAYKPILFTTSAFQQVKVDLTWDETDPRRAEAMKNLFTEDNPNVDISTYLATSSEEEDSEENVDEPSIPKGKVKDKVSKYKELLQNLEDQQGKDRGDVELEITWEPGLKKAAEDLIKEKQKKSKAMTPWEQYLQKRKERKKQKKKQSIQENYLPDSDEDSEDDMVSKQSEKGSSALSEDEKTNDKERDMLELLTGDDKGIDEQNCNVQGKKKSRKKKKQMKLLQKARKQENMKVDVKDSRFSAIYTNPLYNIDPSDSHYKETEGMKAFVEEKQRQMKKNPQFKSHEISTDVIPEETTNLATSLKAKLLKSKRRKIQE